MSQEEKTETSPEESDRLYREAAAQARAGKKAEAAGLLRRAGEAGHGPAQYTLATMLLQGVGIETDRAAALAYMRAAAEQDVAEAVRAAAVLEARGVGLDAPDWPAACNRLIAAARGGAITPARQLGLLARLREDTAPAGAALLAYAAGSGDLVAGLALARLAAEGREDLPISRGEARAFAEKAVQAKHPVAEEIAAKLADAPAQPSERSPELPELQDLAPLAETPPVPAARSSRRLNAQPWIARFDGLLTAVECDYVISLASRLMQPATILDPDTGETRPDPYRKAYHTMLYPLDEDLVLHALDRRIASVSGLAWENGEMLAVLAYTPGQEYKPHYDTLPQDSGTGADEQARGGQRLRTVLVGLTAGYEGGETEFPRLDLSVCLSRGDAVVFASADEAGTPEPASLHAGRPVTSGMKWLASKWMRAGIYRW